MTNTPTSSAGFQEEAANKWNEMRNAAGFDEEEPNLCGDFEPDFDPRGINYELLASDIKNNINYLEGFHFDYRKYVLENEYISSGSTYSSPTTLAPSGGGYSRKSTKPFAYTDAGGVARTGAFTDGRLNKRICYISDYNIGINFISNTVTYSVVFPYKDAAGTEIANDASSISSDFFRNDRYKAIVLEDNNAEIFLGFIQNVFGAGNADACRRKVEEYYTYFLKKYDTDPAALKHLYEQVPGFVLKKLKDTLGEKSLWDHVIRLTEYDDTGMLSAFKDASSALINVLKAIGNTATLFKHFRDDQALVKRIYKNLDGSSMYMEQLLPNQIIFSYMLSALCTANGFEGLQSTGKIFTYGGGDKFDADVTKTFSDEKEDEFFLQQKREIPLMGMDFLPFTEDMDLDKGAMYHPLDMVLYVDSSTSDSMPVPVPAIVIKAISDKDEWQEINRNIRMGFDVLALIAGAITVMTTGNPVIFALAIADMGLAGTDLAIQTLHEEIMQTEGGPEFLATWEKIYLVGGLITAGPLLITGILKSGTALLKFAQAVKNFNVTKFVKTCLLKVFMEVNIANFTGNTVKEIRYGQEALADAGMGFTTAGTTRLEAEGVLFIRGLDAQGATVGFAAIYKGEVIASGTAKAVRETLKDVWTARTAALAGKLDGLLPRWKFRHVPSSGATILETTRSGTYLVGGWKSDLKMILEELHYPIMDDIKELLKGYTFPLPQGQKFNLLYVSERIVKSFAGKGGFFNNVNAKWVDAAVAQGRDIILMTSKKDLYKTVNANGKIKKVLTGYGKEVHRLEWKHGWRFDPESKMMLPPQKASGLNPLTEFKDHLIVNL